MKKMLLLSLILMLNLFQTEAQIPFVSGGSGSNCSNSNPGSMNGGDATGVGCGGGGAGYYGGNGGKGLYGGGGGGAAGYNTPNQSGGKGGDGAIVVAFFDASDVLLSANLYSSSGNITIVAGVTSVKVWAIGAGGGGAGSINSDGTSGGGGGAGGVAYTTQAVTTGDLIACSVGVGGAGGINATNGSAGTMTTVSVGGILIKGNGGTGGQYNTGSDAPGGDFLGGDGGATGGSGKGISGDNGGGGGGSIGGGFNSTVGCGGGAGANSADISGLFAVLSTAQVISTFYEDADGDTYGNPAVTFTGASAPSGYVANSLDCNDANAAIHPNTFELCNGIDDNCDGLIDNDCGPTPSLGEYRSASSGNWSNASTWVRFNGTVFVTAPTPPDNTNGTITIKSGHTVIINSSVTTDETVVESGGTLSQVSSTLSIADGPGEDIAVNGTYNFISGLLNGGGTMSVNGTMDWQAGTLRSTISLQTGSNSGKSTSGIAAIVNGVFINNGTFSWTDGDIQFQDATFNNTGTITALGNNGLLGVGGFTAFNNSGFFSKSIGTGTTRLAVGGTNTGTINVTEGIIHATTDYANAGNINIDAGKTFSTNCIAGAFRLNTGSNFTGAGHFELASGELSLAPGATTATATNFLFRDGTIKNVNGNSPGTLIVTGGLNWQKGTLSSNLILDTNAVLIKSTSGRAKIVDGVLTNNGTFNWSDGDFDFQNATLNNNVTGSFTASGNNNFLFSGGYADFNNAGTFTKTTGTGTTTDSIGGTNTGIIHVEEGVLNFKGPFINSGNINKDAGKTFSVNCSTPPFFRLNTGSNFTGGGNFQIVGGTVSVNAPAATPATATNILFSGGTIGDPAGTLIVKNGLNWETGTLSSNLILDTNAVSTKSTNGMATIVSNGVFTNKGIFNWQDGDFNFQNATLNNDATGSFTATGNNKFLFSAGFAAFNNTGTFTKVTGMDTTTIPIGGTNTGTIHVADGTLYFTGPFANAGNINIDAGKTFSTNCIAGAFRLNTGSNFTGAGHFELASGELSLAPGAITATATNILFRDGTIKNVNGTPGTLIVTGGLNWQKGTLSSNLILDTNAVSTKSTNGIATIVSNGVLTNRGLFNWQDGDFNFQDATLNNDASGSFAASGNNNFLFSGGHADFNNAGSFKKLNGTGTTTIPITLLNTGSIGGLGTLNCSLLNSKGIITPGTSPGLLTINGSQPLSANSNLQIEIKDGSGIGTGHDQLARAGSLTLAGALTVTETGNAPVGTYTIINLTSGSISGSFSTVNLPPCYTLQITATTVRVIKALPQTPFMSANRPLTFCQGDSVLLTSSPSVTYLWSNGDTTQSITVKSSGVFSVVAINARGCSSLPSGTATVRVKQPTSSDSTVTICNSFTWHGTEYKSTGVYTFIGTNAAGCDSTETLHLTILSVTSTFTKIDAGCNSSSTGSITINPTSGVAPYSYRIGTVGSFVSSNTFNNLRAGNYTVSIRDVEGCAGISDQITITEQAALTSTFTKTDAVCNGSATGGLKITPAGGVPPYTYRLGTTGSFVSSDVFHNLRAGNYRVFIKDANGCDGLSDQIAISELPPITGTYTTTDATCFNGASGSITITSTTATVNAIRYRLGSSGTIQSSNTFNNLRAGTYSVFIFDGRNCQGVISGIVVGQPIRISIASTVTDAACFGTATGSVSISASGGAAPYTYRLGTSGAFVSSNTFSNLRAGIYYPFVTDANGCSTVGNTFTINQQAAVTGTFIKTDVTCFGASTGAIDITPTVGVSPFTYRLGSGGAFVSSPTFNGLRVGTYTVTIMDANSCTGFVRNIFISHPPVIAATFTKTDARCSASATGSITITPTAGVPPFSYKLGVNGIYNSSSTFNNLIPGNYVIFIKDANGCEIQLNTISISTLPPITFTTNATNPVCSGAANGTISVSVNGGGSFQYKLGTTGTYQSSNTFTGLRSGTYRVFVLDASGCVTGTPSITLVDPPAITATIDTIHVSCNGGSNGSISINPLTGRPPFLFSLNGSTLQSSNNFSNLPAGNYSVQVYDTAGITGCFASFNNIRVKQPAAIQATIYSSTICANGSNGEIVVTASGGVMPYRYALGLTGYQNSNTFNNLRHGNYSVTIGDANNCSRVFTTTLRRFRLNVTLSTTNPSCYKGSNGEIDVYAQEFTDIYTFYSINSGARVSSGLFQNLTAGTYRINIYTYNGCRDTSFNVTLYEGPQIPGTLASSNPSCFGGTNGSITVNPTSGQSPYLYSIGTSGIFQANNLFTGLRAGSYNVIMQDQAGCRGIKNVVLANPPAIVANIVTLNTSCFAQANGSIVVSSVSNGLPPYTFRLGTSGSFGTTTNFTGLRSGSYRLYVTDDVGCTINRSLYISQPDSVSITISKTDASCIGGTDGSITAIGSGGTPPYQFKFEINGSYSSTNTFSNLGAGNYRIYARDANNCVYSSVPVTLNEGKNPCSSLTPKMSFNTSENNDSKFEVMLSPNPSSSRFTLSVKSTSDQPVQVKVLDVNGRNLYAVKGMPLQTFSFGEAFVAGVYLVEVRQGNDVKTVKALKLK